MQRDGQQAAVDLLLLIGKRPARAVLYPVRLAMYREKLRVKFPDVCVQYGHRTTRAAMLSELALVSYKNGPTMHNIGKGASMLGAKTVHTRWCVVRSLVLALVILLTGFALQHAVGVDLLGGEGNAYRLRPATLLASVQTGEAVRVAQRVVEPPTGSGVSKESGRAGVTEQSGRPGVTETPNSHATRPGVAPSAPISPAGGTKLQRVGHGPTVEMFMTRWCPYCRKAREFFATRGIAVVEYDIEADVAAAQRKKELYSQSGVPLVVINGHLIAGFSPTKYEQALAMPAK